MNIEQTNEIQNSLITSNIGFKRGRDGDENDELFRAEFNKYENLEIDAINYIFSYLKLPSLAVLSNVTKAWSKLTDVAPIWKKLCRESGIVNFDNQSRTSFVEAAKQKNPLALIALSRLFYKNKELRPNFQISKNSLNLILLQPNLSESLKGNVEGRIKLVNALKILYNIRRVNVNNRIGQFNKAVNLLLEVSKNLNVPPKLRLKAELTATLQCLKENSNVLTFDEAGKLLQKIFQSKEDCDKTKTFAKFYFCEFTLKKKISLSNREEITQFLKDLIDHSELATRAKDLITAHMNEESTTFTLNEKMIFAKSLIDLEDITEKVKCEYITKIVTHVILRHTNIFSDEYVIELLQFLINSSLENHQIHGRYLLAMTYLEKRTEIISDEDHFKWMFDFYKKPIYPSYLEDNQKSIYHQRIGLALVKMKSSKHTKSIASLITDEDVSQILQAIYNDKNLNGTLTRDEAIYLILKLQSSSNSLFSNFDFDLKDFLPLLNHKKSSLQGQANYLLALLTFRKQIEGVTNMEAHEWALNAFNNESLNEKTRKNAAVMVQKFKIAIRLLGESA